MAKIQGTLSGIASTWFSQLHEGNKKGNVFVSALKSYYSTGETKKEGESVCHFALNTLIDLKIAIVTNPLVLLKLNVMKISLVVYHVTQKNIAHEFQVKHGTTAMKHSLPFHAMVKLVDAEDNTSKKNPTLDLPLTIKEITSELLNRKYISLKLWSKSYRHFYSKKWSKKQKKTLLLKGVQILSQTKPMYFKLISKTAKSWRKKWSSSSWSKTLKNLSTSAVKLIKTRLIQTHNLPCNIFSRNRYDRWNCSISKDLCSSYRSARFTHLHFEYQRIFFTLDIAIAKENLTRIDIHHALDTMFFTKWKDSRSSDLFFFRTNDLVPFLFLTRENDKTLDTTFLMSTSSKTTFKMYIGVKKIFQGYPAKTLPKN